MGLSLICFSATMPSTLPSLFPTALRAGALSIAFNISISLFGGTTSVVMETLVGKTQNLMWPAYYLMAGRGPPRGGPRARRRAQRPGPGRAAAPREGAHRGLTSADARPDIRPGPTSPSPSPRG
ncbi:ABC transporter permease [Mycobacteroides abscessus subsp. abscessus]|nr:ABC transporter permease [Mycobacteroides abscessus subsp. abscessus]